MRRSRGEEKQEGNEEGEEKDEEKEQEKSRSRKEEKEQHGSSFPCCSAPLLRETQSSSVRHKRL